MTAIINESTVKTTEVRYIAKPRGRARANPPCLADLRAFLAACDEAGIPDDAPYRIQNGSMDEGGRYDVTFSTTHRKMVE